MAYLKSTDKLLNFIENAVTPFHAVLEVKKQLEEAGFEEVFLEDFWSLMAGGRYYVVQNHTSIFAFKVGNSFGYGEYFRIGAAHTDFPGFRLKANPEMSTEGYAQVNVEPYGGVILNSWFDRPLSAAGRVVLRSGQIFEPEVRLVDLKKPLFIIPSLAIHMNREVNKGVELNPQKDMLPILGMLQEQADKQGFFVNYLAKELDVAAADILDFEMVLYNMDVGDVVGLSEDFISAPRLDDLCGVQAVLTGLLESESDHGIQVAAFFDHEEIGSRTKQGAGSTMLSIVLEKIMAGLGQDRMKYIASLADSLIMSVDVAHAYHPNYADKNDPVNKNRLNKGFCIKEASSQAYATDSQAIGILQQICDSYGIHYQKATKRSDVAGGGTLGSIASAVLPVRTVDIGVPMLSMHSSRELIGAEDQEEIIRFLIKFYSLPQTA